MGIRKEDGVVELKTIEYAPGQWPASPDNGKLLITSSLK